MAFYGGLFGWSYKDGPPGAPRASRWRSSTGWTSPGSARRPTGAGPHGTPTWPSRARTRPSPRSRPRAAGRCSRRSTSARRADGDLRRPGGRRVPRLGAGEASGAELVNAPGSWNWSDLETRDIAAAKAFYAAVFGWEYQDIDFGYGPATMIRVPGYGDHLEALNPGTLARHKEAAPRRASPTRSAGCNRRPAPTALPAGRSPSASPTPTHRLPHHGARRHRPRRAVRRPVLAHDRHPRPRRRDRSRSASSSRPPDRAGGGARAAAGGGARTGAPAGSPRAGGRAAAGWVRAARCADRRARVRRAAAWSRRRARGGAAGAGRRGGARRRGGCAGGAGARRRVRRARVAKRRAGCGRRGAARECRPRRARALSRGQGAGALPSRVARGRRWPRADSRRISCGEPHRGRRGTPS